YHVKIQAPGSRLLTTQLYFPDEPASHRDGLFQRELLMRVADAGDGPADRFDSYSIFVRNCTAAEAVDGRTGSLFSLDICRSNNFATSVCLGAAKTHDEIPAANRATAYFAGTTSE